jgi:chorismate mutase
VTQNTMSLDEYRKQIDAIDEQLLALVAARLHIANQIGEWKRQTGMPIFQPKRFECAQNHFLEGGSRFGLQDDFLRQLYQLIHDESCQIQSTGAGGMNSDESRLFRTTWYVQRSGGASDV